MAISRRTQIERPLQAYENHTASRSCTRTRRQKLSSSRGGGKRCAPVKEGLYALECQRAEELEYNASVVGRRRSIELPGKTFLPRSLFLARRIGKKLLDFMIAYMRLV